MRCRFCGMKIFDAKENMFRKYHTQFGWYAKTDEQMKEYLLMFFKPIIDKIHFLIPQLRAIKESMESVNWQLIASSILFIYDSDSESAAIPRAVMIDFAHSYQRETFDTGYVKGVTNLIRFLEEISQM